MERLLAKAAWGKAPTDIQGDSFQRLAAEHSAYLEIEKHGAWAMDRQRIQRLLAMMRQQLEWGTEDKFGRGHDDEKRAVIHVLETVLTYPATIHVAFEREARRRQAEAERAGTPTGPIHGPDIPGPSLHQFLNT